ncbi:MAG TPA: response regulator transcription factor [bacterium]|nr:response regulator transcription factor [bacterium]HMW37048.1 response regulator transcription factor [bacterium]HMY34781.1 response regulator transcription factor [bacterium]HMZ03883.1 response regulator transcription factor [bacterium]HNB08546.1 response regulator transcription factor [bacterium]
MKKLLLVEDEPGLIITLSDRLRREGFVVDIAENGTIALSKARKNRYDIILLDVMLPQSSGLDVCRDLRGDGDRTPILMLTAKSQTTDKVIGLKLGADDYLTKPFDMSELTARIEALLRRSESANRMEASDNYSFNNIEVDFRKAEVRVHKKTVELSAQEFRLLRYMIEHRNATLSRDELLENVWNYGEDITTRTVDVHMAWLRQKLEPNPKRPQYFITVHRLGYKFVG